MAVTYFCFLDTDHCDHAYMEPLDADTLDEARSRALQMAQSHRSAKIARIYFDTQQVAVLSLDPGS